MASPPRRRQSGGQGKGHRGGDGGEGGVSRGPGGGRGPAAGEEEDMTINTRFAMAGAFQAALLSRPLSRQPLCLPRSPQLLARACLFFLFPTHLLALLPIPTCLPPFPSSPPGQTWPACSTCPPRGQRLPPPPPLPPPAMPTLPRHQGQDSQRGAPWGRGIGEEAVLSPSQYSMIASVSVGVAAPKRRGEGTRTGEGGEEERRKGRRQRFPSSRRSKEAGVEAGEGARPPPCPRSLPAHRPPSRSSRRPAKEGSRMEG